MGATEPKPITGWRVWFLAIRPKTLSAAAAPVLVGSAVAVNGGGFRLLPALAALLVGLLVQVGTNLYNDYADFQRGADTSERLGPIRVTFAGLAEPHVVRRAALFCFALAALAGTYLIGVAGWPIAIIGLAAILAGLAYTAGPWPLAYNGLGDLFAWVFFGFVAVCGTAYVQLRSVPVLAWTGGFAMGGLITALLVVNNIRDIDTDRTAGRRTLPVVYGHNAGVTEYALCLAVAFTMPLVNVVWSRGSLWLLLPMLTFRQALRWFRFIRVERGRSLNQALAGTARLVLWFGVLLAVGIVLS